MVRRGKQRGHKRDLIEAGLNEAAVECSDAMGIVRWRRVGGRCSGSLGERAQTAICMQMTLAVERCTRQWRWSMTLRRAVRQRSNIDRHRGVRGAVAGSTASSIEADLDYGWRRRDDHDVSQRNG